MTPPTRGKSTGEAPPDEPEVTDDVLETEKPPAVQATQHWIGIGFAALLAVIGIVVISQALNYGLADEENMIGPGTAPAVLGALLVLGGIVVGIKDVRSLLFVRASLRHSVAEETVPGDGELEDGQKNEQKTASTYLKTTIVVPALIVVLFGSGIFLSQFTGVLITVSLTVMACALIIERMSLLKAAILGVVTFVLGYLLFDLLLAVRFPESVIGF